ncbi:MAG: short chain dehydrogenase [Legionellaceae bacterium]|nr:short chain dehydrogenase [Legionellaceae bacterium]|tara:strand:+ start:136 stop:945 length:810 start_codon:yes stop_codon:yes gene_type:complete
MTKTVFITGASRGIGRAIALKFAQEIQANIIIAAKTTKPHPTLEGTIYSVAEEVEALGARALPIALDVRDDEQITQAFAEVADTFGKLDVLINNASAIHLANTADIAMKRYDLMQTVNTRATFACAKAAIPLLKQAAHPHIVTLSPPLTLEPKWYENHLAYTLSKMGMSLCTLGLAAELKKDNIAVNSVWPKTTIATDAIRVHFPEALFKASRHPEIVADAIYLLTTNQIGHQTGHFFTDEEILTQAGITDFDAYAVDASQPAYGDLFL